jgi:hypothetical protein
MSTRRGFLLGGLAALAAPAIIRPGVLMPVKSLLVPPRGAGLELLRVETLGGAGYDEFVRATLRVIAYSYGLPYEKVAGRTR